MLEGLCSLSPGPALVRVLRSPVSPSVPSSHEQQRVALPWGQDCWEMLGSKLLRDMVHPTNVQDGSLRSFQ